MKYGSGPRGIGMPLNGTPWNRRDNSKTGKRVRHRAQGRYWLETVMMVYLHVELHHLVHVERIDYTGTCRSHCVADKVDGMMVLQHRRIGTKDFALLGLFDVSLQCRHSVTARVIEELKQHFQGVQIPLAGEFGCSENSDHSLHNPHQNMPWIGD